MYKKEKLVNRRIDTRKEREGDKDRIREETISRTELKNISMAEKRLWRFAVHIRILTSSWNFYINHLKNIFAFHHPHLFNYGVKSNVYLIKSTSIPFPFCHICQIHPEPKLDLKCPKINIHGTGNLFIKLSSSSFSRPFEREEQGRKCWSLSANSVPPWAN